MKSLPIQILDFILPPRCAITGDIVSSQGMLAPTAWKELNFIEDPKCERCGSPFDYNNANDGDSIIICAQCLKNPPIYATARSALTYDDTSKRLILGFKHADQTQAVSTFIPWLERVGADMIKNADIITPVPLHPLRLLKRRYNQSGIIAQHLSQSTGVPIIFDLIRRTKNTQIQGYLPRKERKKNIKNAFKITDKKQTIIKNKNIVLIDDVYTTGATVTECTKVLLQSGAANVHILTLARTTRPNY